MDRRAPHQGQIQIQKHKVPVPSALIFRLRKELVRWPELRPRTGERSQSRYSRSELVL